MQKIVLFWKCCLIIVGFVIVVVIVVGIGVFVIVKDGFDGFGFFGMEMVDMGMGGYYGGMMQKVKGGFMEYCMGKMLDKVDVIDEQKQKIKVIFDKVCEDVKVMCGEFGQMCEQMKVLFEKFIIDCDVVEVMCKVCVQKMDDVFKIMIIVMVDVVEVLILDQCVKFVKEFVEKL